MSTSCSRRPDTDTVIPGWSEGPDRRCAIAHRGISRFRVRCGACHRAALCADPLASPGITVAGCSLPAMTRKRPNLLTALRVGRSGRERAAVLFLGGGDHFQVLVGTRHRRAGGEDVPLILDLV